MLIDHRRSKVMATNNKLKQEDAEVAPKKLKPETTKTPVKDATETNEVTAKAGKRSAKAIAEKQQQLVKQQKSCLAKTRCLKKLNQGLLNLDQKDAPNSISKWQA